MTKKQTIRASQGSDKLDGFERQIEIALESYSDAHHLGEISPLAAPYFLGQALDDLPDADRPIQRGHAIQKLLRAGAATLDAFQQRLLDVSFFNRNQHLTNQGVALELKLPERTYYRYRISAIRGVAEAVNRAVLPPLRPESPIPRYMAGRRAMFDKGLDVILSGQSVSITGGGGMGKTTLGAALAQAWENRTDSLKAASSNVTRRVFWYTIRPGLNDQLVSFIFAIGYFLRICGAHNTWRQLVASQGQVRIEHVLGLLRHDLASLAPRPALLCIDEVDLLDPTLDEHAQIVALLEELKGVAPLLMLGQRMFIQADCPLSLDALTLAECADLLRHQGLVELQDDQCDILFQIARGNPALLMLLAVLLRAGDNPEQVLSGARAAPSVELLLQRVWRRLHDAEKIVMMQMAVFRGLPPRDAWAPMEPELIRLQTLDLLRPDGRGAFELAPLVGRFVLGQVPADLRSALHRKAADVMEARGDYTEAMYHHIESGHPALAVWLWLKHRLNEIDRGRATAALTLLQRISASMLTDPRDRDALLATRGALHNFLGRLEDAEDDFRAVSRHADPSLLAYARLHLGSALEAQGRLDQALATYREGLLGIVGSPQYQAISLRLNLTHIYEARLNDVQQARREALGARLESEIFHGSVEAHSGNYAEARARYEAALRLAAGLDGFVIEKSRLYSHFGNLLWKLGDLDESAELLQKSIHLHQQRGDIAMEANDRITLAAVHIMARRFEQAIEETNAGLVLARQLQNAYLISGLTASASEAYFGLGRLHDAEQCAIESLAQEEEAMRTYALAVLGQVRRVQLRLDEAARILRESIQSAQDIEDPYAEGAAWRALGDAHRDARDQAQAREAYASSLAIYERLGLIKEIKELKQALAAVE